MLFCKRWNKKIHLDSQETWGDCEKNMVTIFSHGCEKEKLLLQRYSVTDPYLGRLLRVDCEE